VAEDGADAETRLCDACRDADEREGAEDVPANGRPAPWITG